MVIFVNACHRKGYPELPADPAPLAVGLVSLEDCCNSPDREAHDYCVKKTFPMLGVVCQAEDYARALS